MIIETINDEEIKCDIEIHTDGTKWIACKPNHSFKNNEREIKIDNEKITVYHPDAIILREDDSVGWDTLYKCPHCEKQWWIEIDG